MTKFLKVLVLWSFFLSVLHSQRLILVGSKLKDNNYDIYDLFINYSKINESEPYIGIISAGSPSPKLTA